MASAMLFRRLPVRGPTKPDSSPSVTNILAGLSVTASALVSHAVKVMGKAGGVLVAACRSGSQAEGLPSVT